MSNIDSLRFVKDRAFLCVMLLAVCIVLFKAVKFGLGLQDNFASMGNDDITRLLSVQNLIAGQGWFDTTLYRLAPPEGVSLHWSRYIDAGIAAIILPLSLFMSMPMAEMIAAAIWPTVILLVTICVVGFGTRRLFGMPAACFAVLCLVFWPLTADLHARAGNLDHHNVQLLMMIILALAAVWTDRPVQAGIAAGTAAAFSLAVGLETLLFVVGVGLVIWGRAAFNYGPLTARLLGAFAVTLPIASVIFFLGQTPPDAYAAAFCDQLRAPALSLIAVASLASLLPLALRRMVPGPAVQIVATVIVAAIGLALAWPLLGPCITGPYGDLPVAVQEAISNRITEARPGIDYFQQLPGPALVFMIPVLSSLIAGTILWRHMPQGTPVEAARRRALGQLLVLCLLGTGMVFIQMRTVILVASVVPVIGGVALAALLHRYLQSRDLTVAMLMLALAVAITSPILLVQPIWPYLKQANADAGAIAADCQDYSSLQALNAVPPAKLFTHGNFGTRVIWATHHDTLGGLYHRSAAALENGMLAFGLEEAAFREHLAGTVATHVLLCRNQNYESDFLTTLADNTAEADWLRPVALQDDAQVLLEILP